MRESLMFNNPKKVIRVFIHSKKFRDLTLYLRFIIALFSANKVKLEPEFSSGSIAGWPLESLQFIIDEGRRQLDDQMETLNRILVRAQILLTTLLALIGFASSMATRLLDKTKSHSIHGWVVVLIVVSIFCLLMALLGSAALVAVKKSYDVINIVVISKWQNFSFEKVAQDFVDSIDNGNVTNNSNLTIFSRAVRFTMFGVLGMISAFLLTQFC